MNFRYFHYLAPGMVLFCLSGCTSAVSTPAVAPQPKAALYSPTPTFVQEGIASWYGGRWIGRLTANGERYKAGDMTAAHKKLPFHTKVRVTDLKTGKQVIVRINNRGPFVKGRIIDLSVVAAKQLGTYDRGLARVRIEALKEIPQMTKPNLKPNAKATPKATPMPRTPKTASPQGAMTKPKTSGGRTLSPHSADPDSRVPGVLAPAKTTSERPTVNRPR